MNRFVHLVRNSLPLTLLAVACLSNYPCAARAADDRFPFYAYLTGDRPTAMVTYTPSLLDPRQEANQGRLATSSIRDDLTVLRPVFDGLVLYGYHEACTPRILAVARDLGFRAMLLGVWNPKSADELDGVADLARRYEHDFALGILVGNEGLTFGRYEEEDLTIAAARLRAALPAGVPLATSEPLVGYQRAFVRDFGDFLAPNIHPVFDRPEVPADEAAAWARQQAADLARQVGRPVLLKETGFPHAGQDIYSPETQWAFWRAYLAPGRLATVEPVQSSAGAWAFHGVAFEAFDLPWKSEESKLPIESAWGLFSPTREPWPALNAWRGEGHQPKP